MKKRDATKNATAGQTPLKMLDADEATRRDCEELIRSVELLGVHLVRSQAELHLERAAGGKTGKVTVKIDQPLFRASFTDAERILYCGVRFHLAMGSSTDSPIVDLDCEYSLYYRVPPHVRCPKDAALAFAGRNAVFNAWPFFRAHAHGIVGAMGLPPVVVPLFRLPAEPPKNPAGGGEEKRSGRVRSGRRM